MQLSVVFFRFSRRRRALGLLIAVFPLAVRGVAAEPSTTLAHFPNTGINAIKVDAAGNIYVAGFQGTVGTSDSYDAFVAKLSPDGSRILYSTKLGGSHYDMATALDVDAAGAAYIAGPTESPDFPVTAGALQTTMPAGSLQGFVAKVDAGGKVVYATLVGGDSSYVQPGPGGLVVDAAGDAVVSGQTVGGDFPSAPGAPFAGADENTYFVVKLDSTGGKLLAAIRGVGGRIAQDGQGSIYVAGSQYGSITIPVSQGAFQTSHELQACPGTGQLELDCAYQYVTKLNGSLTQIEYSTYVTGSWGAAQAAIGVDAQENVWLAGTTNSPDYPTTPDAFEPFYIANAPPPPQACLFGCVFPPPASGYVTKLNAAGTGLIYSTFFSGTQADTIGFAAFTDGGIYVSGQAGSSDLPGLEGVPSPCLNLPDTFETRLGPDGLTVAAARVIPGDVLAYNAAAGMLLAWTGADLIGFDPAAPQSPIACIVDAADLRPVNAIAPGELLSVFGAHFVNETDIPPSGSFGVSLGGVAVGFNGLAGPLLYVSPRQINVQAPYEIANDPLITLHVNSSEADISDSRTLAVVARNPAAFLDTAQLVSPGSAACRSNYLYRGGPLPVAFNSDGSRNTCVNPAGPDLL